MHILIFYVVISMKYKMYNVTHIVHFMHLFAIYYNVMMEYDSIFDLFIHTKLLVSSIDFNT